jgi:U3 small nucleolar RNA-associated protein 5
VVVRSWIETKDQNFGDFEPTQMASINPNGKQKKVKPPKSRPVGTSTLSQPITQQTGSLATLAAFSPKANLFALLSLAVDRHRLRVYDTATSQANAEYIVQAARVTCLRWMDISSVHSDPIQAQKKKRKRESASSSSKKSKTQVVALGLSTGAVTFFSPAHGSSVLTLLNSASNTAILDAVLDINEDRLWTSSEDASIRLWDMTSNTILQTWKSDDRIPYTRISLEPRVMDESSRPVGLLAAHHAAKLLSINLSSEPSSSKPTIFASFSGHTTPISNIAWTTSKQFITVAQGDKFIQGWTMPKNGGVGTVAFSAALDAEARKAYVSPSGELIVATSVSGALSIFRIPSQHDPASSLAPDSVVNISISRGKGVIENADVVDAVFSVDSPGVIHVARLVAGVRPAFETVVCSLSIHISFPHKLIYFLLALCG